MSTRRKQSAKIAQPTVKSSAKKPLKSQINEADTAVSTSADPKTVDGAEEPVIELSSDAESEYDFSDDDQEESKKPAKLAGGKSQEAKENGDSMDTDMASPHQPADGESDQEPPALTFGDLVRANETIDVPAALSAQQSASLSAPSRVIAPPNSASLGTVLTQALRTDDADLLESCLHTTDLTTVCNTIQRLDSSLAGALLTKLAARMHRRPGRAGSLMTWVQWTLISHGGALATQPDLVKKLSDLHRVLEERSRGLNSLLSLKGKLDLLEGQMKLRRSMQTNGGAEDDDNEDADNGVVYVEGEEDLDADMVDDEEDEMAVTNGFADEDGSDEEDEESSEGEGSEEELEGVEELDENEVNHEDVESDEEESEQEAPPPSKKSRTGGLSSKRR